MNRRAVTNLLRSLPQRTEQEIFERIAEGDSFFLERIVSFGHVTTPETWYDQERDEWVLLLSGAARLRFEDDAAAIELSPGHALLIAAHRRHRVEWTAPDCETVWLALHFCRTAEA